MSIRYRYKRWISIPAPTCSSLLLLQPLPPPHPLFLSTFFTCPLIHFPFRNRNIPKTTNKKLLGNAFANFSLSRFQKAWWSFSKFFQFSSIIIFFQPHPLNRQRWKKTTQKYITRSTQFGFELSFTLTALWTAIFYSKDIDDKNGNGSNQLIPPILSYNRIFKWGLQIYWIRRCWNLSRFFLLDKEIYLF